MTELENNLRRIAAQKQELLIPENIRKNVKVLGITGTLEGGSGDITETEDYKNCYEITQDILYSAGVTKNLLVKYDLSRYETGSMIPNMIDSDFATVSGATYSKGEKGIILDGACIITEDINKAYGTVELFCKINSNFTPLQNSYWYNCSAIFGCELGDTQQDFAVIIDKNGNFAIGYANSSIQSSNIKANDGMFHHIVLTYESGNFYMYIDNVLAASVYYVMKGTVPVSYGIFWNNANINTIVKGEVVLFRYYDRVLNDEERTINYNSCLNIYMGGE